MVQKSFFYLTTLSSLFDPETLGVLIAHSSRAGSQSPGPSPLSLLSCPATDPHPRPPALALPTHTGHTSPPTLCAPSAMSHPARPTTQPRPSQTHCSKSRPLTQQTEQRTSPSLPQLPVFPPPASTPVDIYLKKVTFEAKTRLGAGCWEEGAFSVHAVQTLRQAALSQLGSLLSPRQTWLPS